jgi:hypothetical protein
MRLQICETLRQFDGESLLNFKRSEPKLSYRHHSRLRLEPESGQLPTVTGGEAARRP